MQPNMNPMSQDMDEDNDSDELKMKLLGLTRILEGIESISSDELKPFLDDMIQKAHMTHEGMESPAEEAKEQHTGEENEEPMEDETMGEEEPMDDDSMGGTPKGPGIEIGIGVGKPKEDMDSEGKAKPKGLLAILATRAKKPFTGK